MTSGAKAQTGSSGGSGSGITQLTGDVTTPSGSSGSAAATLQDTSNVTSVVQTILSGNNVALYENNSVTPAGSTQATATPLTAQYNVVNATANGQGVLLPNITQLGQYVYIDNANNSYSLQVYPYGTQTIDAFSAGAAITLSPGAYWLGVSEATGTSGSWASVIGQFMQVNGPTSGSNPQGALSVGGALTYNDTNILESLTSNVNSYDQAVIQNQSNGSSASASYVVSNNLGTASTYFAELGMNSSGFTGTGAFNQASNAYLASSSSDLAIGTYGSNAIHFVVNNGATDAMTISSAGSVTLGTALPIGSGGTGSKLSLGLQNVQNALPLGVIGQSFDCSTGATSTVSISTSSAYFMAVYLIAGQTFQNYWLTSSASGSSGTISFGLYYSSTGASPSSLVTGSNYSATGIFTGANCVAFALSAPVTIPATGVYYIAFSATGGGTIVRGGQVTALYTNPLLNGSSTTGFTAGLRFGSVSTAALASSYSSTSITPQGGILWVGLS